MSGVLDKFIAFKFISILVKPFNRTKAFKLGLIDDRGEVLVPRSDLKTREEKKAFGVFHQVIWNIKKLLARLPGGATQIGSIAAAMWLMKESTNEGHMLENPAIFEEVLLEHLVREEYLTEEQCKKVLTEQKLDDTILRGKYQISSDAVGERPIDIREPQGEVSRGDVFVVKRDITAFDTILGEPIFKVPHPKKDSDIIVVSKDDIERV